MSTVKKRHVFYCSGFDPRGPAYYHPLYKAEALRQSAVNGMALNVGMRARPSQVSNSWNILARSGSDAVATTYEFLRWDDIIRKHWQSNELRIILDYLHVMWLGMTSGMLGRVLKTAWPPFLAAAFPLAMILLAFCAAIGAGWGIAHALGAHGLSGWIAVGGGLLGFAAVLQCCRLIERKVNSFWLLRIYAFTKKQGIDNLPELEERLDAFSRRIVDVARQADADEILLVGHSTGTMNVVSVLARALQQDPQLATRHARISLMTLGHCIPILSFIPAAQRFRNELATVANAANIDWIDFTAPTDGACFSFIDPVAASGIARRPDAEVKPKILSARFVRLFKPQTYARMKRDWYRHHFQYLMASELAGDYDYFAITAGAMTLGERYRTHAPVTNFTGLKVFK